MKKIIAPAAAILEDLRACHLLNNETLRRKYHCSSDTIRRRIQTLQADGHTIFWTSHGYFLPEGLTKENIELIMQSLKLDVGVMAAWNAYENRVVEPVLQKITHAGYRIPSEFKGTIDAFLDRRGRHTDLQTRERALAWIITNADYERQDGKILLPCPYQQTTTRDLMLDPKDGRFYCFDCHRRGDVRDLAKAIRRQRIGKAGAA